MAHEIGHYLQQQMEISFGKSAFFQGYDDEKEYSFEDLKERFTLSELYADKFAAALLMPRWLILRTLQRYVGNRSIPLYGSSLFCPKDKQIVQAMAADLGVSYSALLIQLRNYQVLEMRPVSEFIQKLHTA